MAITNIQVNFTPCPDPPVGGYNIEYRVVGDTAYIDAGSFVSSPANILVSYPDGTEFEGIVHSPCGDVVWSTADAPTLSITADNGLTMSTPTNVQLGGTLLHTTTIGSNGFETIWTGSVGPSQGQVVSNNIASGGSGFFGIAPDGIGVQGLSTNNTGGSFFGGSIGSLGSTDSGIAVAGIASAGGLAGEFDVNSTNADQVFPHINVTRGTSSTPAVGIGASFTYSLPTLTNNYVVANELISELMDVADATVTSNFRIKGVGNAVNQTLFELLGDGQGTLNLYGTGLFADTPVFGLGVLADGTIVEYDPAGGSGGSGTSLFRFGYITEDDTAGEDRVFQLGTDYQVRFNGSVPGGTKDSMFKVTNAADEGTSIYGVSTGADGVAVRGDSDGVAGLFISVNDAGVVAQSTDGPGALIHSTNDIGAQISTDNGSYATESRTTTTVDNNTVHPNLLLNAVSTIVPVADGFGQSIDFQTNTTDLPTTRISNQIISTWLVADDATGLSYMTITGVAAGALQNLLFLIGDGRINLPLGLPDYADDTAAAAGSPTIDVGGLYRNGNVVQIRVT